MTNVAPRQIDIYSISFRRSHCSVFLFAIVGCKPERGGQRAGDPLGDYVNGTPVAGTA